MANTTRKSSRKSTETAAAGRQFNMSVAHEEIDLSSDDDLLASMLADVDADDAAVPVIDIADDDAIEAAVADIERAEAVESLYADQDGEPVAIDAADTPITEAVAEEKPKKAKKAKAPKADKVPTVHFNGHRTNADEVLKARLGEKVSEMLILEVDDAALDPTTLEAKQAELLALLSARPNSAGDGPKSQQKVAEKVVALFNWMKNGGALNKVMEITFKTLARDGEITTGEKGNLHAELLAKPYSLGTARAQGGQMMSMLPMLKIATKTEKGRLVANPNSLLLMKAKADLGLA